MDYGSSQAKDWIQAVAATWATAAAVWDLWPTVPGQGSNPHLCSHPRYHSGNSNIKIIDEGVYPFCTKSLKSHVTLHLQYLSPCMSHVSSLESHRWLVVPSWAAELQSCPWTWWNIGVGFPGSSQQHSSCWSPILVLFWQGQLLSIPAAYGDLETVRYLLTERLVELPTEPTDDNPAVVAAQFGHTDVVQELLESLPGKSQGVSSYPPFRDSPLRNHTGIGGGELHSKMFPSCHQYQPWDPEVRGYSAKQFWLYRRIDGKVPGTPMHRPPQFPYYLPFIWEWYSW